MKNSFLRLFFFAFFSIFLLPAIVLAAHPTTIYFFYNSGCSHCAAEKPFLATLVTKYPELTVKSYEVWTDQENVALFNQLAQAYGISANGVPITFIGESVVTGYSTDEISGKEIEAKIKNCLDNGCINPIVELEDSAAPAGEEETPVKITPSSIAQPTGPQIEPKLILPAGVEIATTSIMAEAPTIKMELSPINVNIEEGEVKFYKYIPSVPTALVESQKEAISELEIETKSPLIVEEDKLIIKDIATDLAVEVGVKPEQAVSIVSVSSKVVVEKVSLNLDKEKPVYSLELNQQAKFLGFIPIQVKTEVEISGDDGKILSFKKPWWSFLTRGLITNFNI
ncbi:MAG: thioredoxin family protein [Patescibacteria group bacterium]|jgi:thiol-disulfide isomerase/thioredoxin